MASTPPRVCVSRTPRSETLASSETRAFRASLSRTPPLGSRSRSARARAPASDDVGLIAPRASLFPNEEALSETAAEALARGPPQKILSAPASPFVPRRAADATPRGSPSPATPLDWSRTPPWIPRSASKTAAAPVAGSNLRAHGAASRVFEQSLARRDDAPASPSSSPLSSPGGAARGRPSPSPSPSRRSIDPGGERARAPQPYAPQHVRVRKRKRVRSGSPRQLAGPGRLERRVARRNSRVGNVRRRRVFFRLRKCRARVRRDGARVPDGLRARVSRGLLPGRADTRI